MTSFLGYDAVEEILAAVEAEGLPRPLASTTKEWRVSFAKRLFSIFSWHAVGLDLHSDARQRRRVEALRTVAKHATKLGSLLGDDSLALRTPLGEHLRDDASIDDILTGLRSLAAAASASAKPFKAKDGSLKPDALKAPMSSIAPTSKAPSVNALIGQLAVVFEAFFGAAPTITYDPATREPSGHFIAFAIAVLRQVEIAGGSPPMTATAEAVAQAHKRWQRAADNG